jgi:hypothetical protein
MWHWVCKECGSLGLELQWCWDSWLYSLTLAERCHSKTCSSDWFWGDLIWCVVCKPIITTKLQMFFGHYEALLSFALPLFLSCRYFERDVKVIPDSLTFLVWWILAQWVIRWINWDTLLISVFVSFMLWRVHTTCWVSTRIEGSVSNSKWSLLQTAMKCVVALKWFQVLNLW